MDEKWALGPAVAAAAVVGYAVVATAVTLGGTPPTSYAAASRVAHAAGLAAGLGLLAAGLLALSEPRRRRLGVLATLAGIAWFGPDWESWDGGPALIRSLGAVAGPLFLALIVHVALTFPTARAGRSVDRAAVVAVYALATTAAIGRALVREPFLDPACWRSCLDNSFLVHADQHLGHVADDLWRGSTVGIALALVVLAAARIAGATAAGRRLLLPGAAAGALVAVAAAAHAVALGHDPFEDPRLPLWRSLYVALAATVCALAVAIGWSVADVRRVRAAVGQLATQLADGAGGLQARLRAALGDPQLEVVYRLPGRPRFVDAAGHEASPVARGRTATPVERGGEPLAVVLHDAALLDVAELGAEIGSAARLAVDNERLQAERLAQVEAVRESRARIVEAGDEERRRLERDLHDGAQQRLLGLSYRLRLARAAAGADTDPAVVALLSESADEVQLALDELRRLAHGIFPAVLAEAGLASALETLADTAPLPVELSRFPADRLPAPVEAAAYATVAEAVADASTRGASYVEVSARRDGGRLVVAAEDDGAARDTAPMRIADRVGALGGSVAVEASRLEAQIPCG